MLNVTDINTWGNNNLGFGVPTQNSNNEQERQEEKRLSMNALLDNTPKAFYCRKCGKVEVVDDWAFSLRFSMPNNADEDILRSMLERFSFNVNLMCKCSYCETLMQVCNPNTIDAYSALENKGYYIANFDDGNVDDEQSPGFINFLPGVKVPGCPDDWSKIDGPFDTIVVNWEGRDDFGYATGFPTFKIRYMSALKGWIDSLPECESTTGYDNAIDYINMLERGK